VNRRVPWGECAPPSAAAAADDDDDAAAITDAGASADAGGAGGAAGGMVDGGLGEGGGASDGGGGGGGGGGYCCGGGPGAGTEAAPLRGGVKVTGRGGGATDDSGAAAAVSAPPSPFAPVFAWGRGGVVTPSPRAPARNGDDDAEGPAEPSPRPLDGDAHHDLMSIVAALGCHANCFFNATISSTSFRFICRRCSTSALRLAISWSFSLNNFVIVSSTAFSKMLNFVRIS